MSKERSNVRLLDRALAKSVLAVLLLVSVWGCKGGSATDPQAGLNEDQKAISELVGKVSDTSGALDRFRALYVKGKAPSSTEAEKFKGAIYYIKGDIAVSGNTANFTTAIERSGDAGPVVVEKPWTAVKEADGWKLSDTPVP